jgi:hypothetical protein
LLAVGFLTRKADRICVCSWLIDEIPVSMGWRLVQRLEWVDQSHSIRPNPAGAFARESLQPVGSRRPAPLDITPDLARHSERGIHRLARRASAPQAGTRACGSPTCAAQTGQEETVAICAGVAEVRPRSAIRGEHAFLSGEIPISFPIWQPGLNGPLSTDGDP